ncbi:MAG TPA: hypothetical protein VJR47_10955 [Stellaceae bacterium]|nr:hypothetical protein [Stellaceae bacterium]
MKHSILIVTLALGLSTGLGAVAYADQSAPTSPPTQDQSAQMPTRTQSVGADFYRASLARSYASPYDFMDAYTTPDGFPAPGWAHMNNTK